MFAAHLRSDLTLAAATIDQYFSHAINSLKEMSILDCTATLRSSRLKMMLTTFSNEDRVGRPLRTVEKIPLTASLLVVAYDLLYRLYSLPVHAARLLGLAAALSLGYGLSLRPDEYLKTNSVANDSHIARGYKSYFMWPNDPIFYVVTRPQDYPSVTVKPVIFVTFLDASKNDLHGKGAPRAVQGGVAGAPFDLVVTIFECLRRFPPVEKEPLLSGLPFSMTDRVVREFLKSLADHVHLDRKRLVPHSPRVAAVMQLAHHSVETQCRQGNWMSVAGMLAYARGSLYHASLVSADLHDPTIVSVEYLRLMFMSPH
jgi:hypothetical protein